MNLSDFDRVEVHVVNSRYPAAWERTRDLLRSRGAVEPRCLLNGPHDSPHLDRVGRGSYQMIHHAEPPIAWLGERAAYHHSLAFRETVRRARADGLRHVLVAEDDLTLTPAFDAVVGAARVPDDWAFLYYGANHTWHPTEEVGPNLLRLHGSLCTHLVAIRATAFDAFLDLPEIGPMDWSIGVYLHHRFPSYALWPSVALQRPGLSTMTGHREDYSPLFASKGKNWPSPQP